MNSREARCCTAQCQLRWGSVPVLPPRPPTPGPCCSPALHKQGQHRALCPALPATITAAHPDPPGCITAQSTPHPGSSVLHTHPNTGVKATPQQSWEQLLAFSSCAKARPCSSIPELAGARLPCWHPELPLAPTTDPAKQTGAARQTLPCSLPSKFSCALGNGSRLDPVCSGRKHPEMEKCSPQMGRAMKGRDSSSGEIQAGSGTSLLGSGHRHPPTTHQLKHSRSLWELL